MFFFERRIYCNFAYRFNLSKIPFMKIRQLLFLALTPLLFVQCGKDSDAQFSDPCGGKAPGGAIDLLISTEDDIKMGLASVHQIDSLKSEYNVIDSASNAAAYAHIYRIRNTILAGGLIYYDDVFPWKVRLIKNDSVLNAFCTPGGFIYVYTGLIKYLDNETQLAGVMGHEMGHADRRHGAKQLIQIYGASALLSILTGGNPNQLQQIGVQLLLLKNSRSDETEADSYSVRYLYPTEYDPRGAKYFFEKIGSQGTPEFLSTHPNPENRVTNIEEVWKCLGSRTGGTFDSRYAQFKASLP
jgi:hypothetical protein